MDFGLHSCARIVGVGETNPKANPLTGKARLGVLLSGRGTNFLAIADRIADGRLPGAEIVVVISNVPGAPGLAAAQQRGIETMVLESRGRKRAEHDFAVREALEAHGVDLVVLAGYLRLLTPEFVQAFPQRILNIHPSLLPAFPGLEAQEQAWEHGVKVSGCTVHFVDEELDHGVIVLQRVVRTEECDDAEDLAARILREEHEAYSEAIAQVLSGEWEIKGRRWVRRQDAVANALEERRDPGI
jgi:phosphoribosylglycinamide formyltransferase-1